MTVHSVKLFGADASHGTSEQKGFIAKLRLGRQRGEPAEKQRRAMQQMKQCLPFPPKSPWCKPYQFVLRRTEARMMTTMMGFPPWSSLPLMTPNSMTSVADKRNRQKEQRDAEGEQEEGNEKTNNDRTDGCHQ